MLSKNNQLTLARKLTANHITLHFSPVYIERNYKNMMKYKSYSPKKEKYTTFTYWSTSVVP